MKAPEYPATEQWRNNLRDRIGGQDANKPSTWKLDALWRAACYEAAARDAKALGMDPNPHLERAAKQWTPTQGKK